METRGEDGRLGGRPLRDFARPGIPSGRVAHRFGSDFESLDDLPNGLVTPRLRRFFADGLVRWSN